MLGVMKTGACRNADPPRLEPLRALGRAGGRNRRVIDDQGGAQTVARRVEDGIYDGIIGQHDVHALGAGDRLGHRPGGPDADRLERLGLRRGAIPRGHLIAALRRGFRERAAHETRPEKGDGCHDFSAG